MTDQQLKRWQTWIGIAILVIILGVPVWLSNWFYQRGQLLNLASDVRFASTDSARTDAPEWNLFRDPVFLSFPHDVRLSGHRIRTIGGFEGLEMLSASGIGDDNLSHLRNLSNLHSLDLQEASLSDAGLNVIGQFKKLRTLTILAATDHRIDRQITTGGWTRLLQLPELTRLTLADSELTDAAIEPLGQCSGLIELQLTSPNIHGAGLRHLGQLKSLIILRLNGSPMDAPGSLGSLTSNPGLRALWLRETRITDARLKELVALPGLIEVNLEETGVTDQGIKQLQQERTDLRVFDTNGRFWSATVSESP